MGSATVSAASAGVSSTDRGAAVCHELAKACGRTACSARRPTQLTRSPVFRAGSVLLCVVALLPGCERKASNEIPKAPATPPKETANLNQAGTNATEIVQITGGKFIMGDKDEVDAPPHEAVVSSFFIDKHLVTQVQFQKVMGANPSRW